MLRDDIKFIGSTAISSVVSTGIVTATLIFTNFVKHREVSGKDAEISNKIWIPFKVVLQIGCNVFLRKVVNNFLIIDDCKDHNQHGFVQKYIYCVDKNSTAAMVISPVVGIVSGALTTRMFLKPDGIIASEALSERESQIVKNALESGKILTSAEVKEKAISELKEKAISEYNLKLFANPFNSAVYEAHSSYEAYQSKQPFNQSMQNHNATRLIASAIIAEGFDSGIKHKHLGGIIDGMAISTVLLFKDYIVDTFFAKKPNNNSTDKQQDFLDIVIDKTIEVFNFFSEQTHVAYDKISEFMSREIAASGDNADHHIEM